MKQGLSEKVTLKQIFSTVKEGAMWNPAEECPRQREHLIQRVGDWTVRGVFQNREKASMAGTD